MNAKFSGTFPPLRRGRFAIWIFALAVLMTSPLWADGGITFTDVTADVGIDFAHAPTPRLAEITALKEVGVFTIPEFVGTVRPEAPAKPYGAPGVALLDFDGDGDLDIYVANSPGAANGLFANQLAQTGELAFVDVAAAAGVAATDHDSSGVCFGDVDNDGDPDLYVLGIGGDNLFFENGGDGTFTDRTAAAGVGGEGRNAVSCSFADLNADGLLDLVVGNTYDDWNHNRVVFSPPPEGQSHHGGIEHNQIFVNAGDNVFVDASAAAGIESVSNMAGPGLTGAAFTWALAPFDVDRDGDVDLLFADNQAWPPPPDDPSQERGYLRLYRNDGLGSFEEITEAAGLDIAGAWMGLDAGDLNCDGYLDFFATDVGYPAGAPSRWFLGQPDGTFYDSVARELKMTPFGWGVSIFDYDNDGDADVGYHGGNQTIQAFDGTNMGVILQNQGACTADFTWDRAAVGFDHRFRSVQGMAVGDLDGNGFEDVVTVSDFNLLSGDLITMNLIIPTGSFFDFVSGIARLWGIDGEAGTVFFIDEGNEIGPGDLKVETSSGNDNGWVEIVPRGSIGTATGARVNRDGIGAVISFTPVGGKTVTEPVMGGSSYASQDALASLFGLGEAPYGTVEILWPGGVLNRVRGVRAGERLVVPEIPCDLATRGEDPSGYATCVQGALNELVAAGVIDPSDRGRFERGAFACASSSNTLCLMDDRFEVSVAWEGDLGLGQLGEGHVKASTDKSGTFYFFGGETVEMHVNVLDGCALNGHYWVYAAASTDLATALTVTDTETGTTMTYSHPGGGPASAVTDHEAFAVCP